MPPPPTEVFASRLFLGPALRAQPDRRLVTLVREGYEAAFEEIVRRYGRPLARYAASIVGSRSEDITQDAFSKALLAMRRDENEIDLRPWLYRIVRNTALNDLRDRPPTPEILEEAIVAGRGTAAEAEQREALRELIERLQALPERQRAAIVMRELEGLSHDEIAAALGLSGGAARQVIFRAREALRSGAGMLLPLPLLRVLLENGAGATAGAGAAGALAAGGAAGGAGTVLKAGAVAVIIAGSVGTGLALQQNHGREETADAAVIGASRGPQGHSGALHRSAGGSADAAPGSVSDGGGAARHRGGSGSGSGESHVRTTVQIHAGGNSGPNRSGGGGGPLGTSRGGPGQGGPVSSGHGGGAISGPVGGENAEAGDRHGGSSGGSDDSSGPSGGGSDETSGPGSGISGGTGTEDHSGSGSGGSDDGSPTTEPTPAQDGTTSSGDGSSTSSGGGSGGDLESSTEPSLSGRDGGGDSSQLPAS
jgi:RNA polymerase sigma factor (sigma-70 family)